MYSMVLMAAMTPTGDAASFGKKGGGCTGDAAGCTGYVVDSGSCSGKHGGGFLGLRNRGGCTGNSCDGGGKHHGNSCNGGGFLGGRSGGGLFKGHKSNGCNGGGYGGGCTGAAYYAPAAPAVHGAVTGECAVVPGTTPPSTSTPEAMPKVETKTPEVKPEAKPEPKPVKKPGD